MIQKRPSNMRKAKSLKQPSVQFTHKTSHCVMNTLFTLVLATIGVSTSANEPTKYEVASKITEVIARIEDAARTVKYLEGKGRSEATHRYWLPKLEIEVPSLLADWNEVKKQAWSIDPEKAFSIEQMLDTMLNSKTLQNVVVPFETTAPSMDFLSTSIDQIDLIALITFSRISAGLVEASCPADSFDCKNIAANLGIPLRSEDETKPAPPFLISFAEPPPAGTLRESIPTSRAGTYISGTSYVPNPDYQSAIRQVQLAEAKLQSAIMAEINANMLPSGLVGGFERGVAAADVAKAKQSVHEAKATLDATPTLVQKSLVSTYQYAVKTVTAVSSRRIGVALIDTRTNTIRFHAVSKNTEKQFTVAEGVHPTDVNATYADKKEIENWLSAENNKNIVVGDLRPNGSYGITRIDNNLASTIAASINKYFFGLSLTPLNENSKPTVADKMNAVVMIRNGDYLGAGFYVGTNHVLTNAHVVSGGAVVTMKLAGSDTETEAEVVARDERRDLALLRTPTSHSPAKLLPTDRNMPIGKAIEVVGHPDGLEFSIASGVISGIRSNLFTMPDVKLIQSDVSINPGNSGGPMYMGDHVIGVVTWKKSAADGLGFAVHIHEVRQFLQRAFLF